MSVDLKFKHGLWASLQDQSVENGTIYVTTDEKSMYVDLNNKRIRIQGTVLYFDSLDEFAAITTPPYNEDTLYFFRTYDDNTINALMAWSQKDGWKQVNVTADDFSSLTTSVNNLTTTVTQLSTNLTALTTRVTNAEATITSHGQTLTAHGTAIDKNTSDIATNSADIATNAAGVKKNKEDIASANSAITGLAKRVSQNETDIKSNDTDIANLDTRVTANEGNIKNNTENITKNASDISTTNTKLENLTTRVTSAESAISTHTGQLNTHAGNITTLQGEMSTAQGNISDLQTQTAGHTSQLTTIESNITALQGKDTDHEAALSSIQNTIKTLATAKDLQEAFKAANESIQENAEAIEENADEISKLWDEVGSGGGSTSLSGRVQALEQEDVTIKGDITNIKNQITTINSKDSAQDATLKTHGEEIAAIKAKNEEQSKSIGDNASAIERLDTRLTTAEGTITTHGTDINNLKNSVKNITDNYATKEELSDVEEELREELTGKIDDHILGANAMTYQGTVSTRAQLDAKTNVKVGDTWIAAVTSVDDGFAAGDFFVATGTEDPTTGYITTVTWNHVKSGYDQSLNPKLITEANVIKLQTYAGNNLGAVTIASKNNNLTVETEGTTPGARTISVNMVWDTF